MVTFEVRPGVTARVDTATEFGHGFMRNPTLQSIGKPGRDWVAEVRDGPGGKVVGVCEVLSLVHALSLAEAESVAGHLVEFRELVGREWKTRVVVGRA
jgi:hypothetical protein